MLSKYFADISKGMLLGAFITTATDFQSQVLTVALRTTTALLSLWLSLVLTYEHKS